MAKAKATKQGKLSGSFGIQKKPQQLIQGKQPKSEPLNFVLPKAPKEEQELSEQEIQKIVQDPIYSKALKDILGSDKLPRYHQQDLNTIDKLLRQFDMTAEYGPSAGLTRLQRYNRALKLKKSPPPAVKKVLETPLGLLDRYKYSYLG